jgi:hypothetical protein
VSDGGGQFTYTPDNDFIGTDTFTYTATSAGGTATGTITVAVKDPFRVTTSSNEQYPGGGLVSLWRALDNTLYWTVSGTPAITFDMTQVGPTITLDGGFSITRDVDIVGPGAGQLTIERDANAVPFRLFEVDQGVTVSFSGLTFSGGSVNTGEAGTGGGAVISSRGNLVVEDCTFTNNSVFGESELGRGGAILAQGWNQNGVRSGSLWLSGSNFYCNSAPYGGAVAVGADNLTTAIRNCEFSGNSASGSGGALFLGGNPAIGGSNATISNCTLDSNTAAVCGGGIYAFAVTLVLSDGAVISNNSADIGGGVYILGQVVDNAVVGHLTYDGVSIGCNTARIGDGVYREKATTSGSGVTWFGNPVNSEAFVP